MEFRAIHRWAPMSSRKARLVADLVKGLSANEALEALTFQSKRAAIYLSKVIRSAVANAGQVGGVEASRLRIKSAIVNDGGLKQGRMRFRPGPMGRAMPIRKRCCHIEVVLEVREGAAARPRRAKADTKDKAPASAGGQE